jgi:Flp pilus assembly protein CpaB
MQAVERVVPRTAARMRRLDLRVVAGLILMLLAIGGSMGVIRKAQSRVPVLVAARTVEAGDVIKPTDLRVEDISVTSGVTYLAASRRGSVIGKVATERLWPGKLLGSASVAESADLPAGYVAMSLALKADRAAGGSLHTGDHVAVISSGSPERPETAPTILFADIPVLDARAAETAEGGGVIVTLRLRLEEARLLAAARGMGSIDLVLLSGAEP